MPKIEEKNVCNSNSCLCFKVYQQWTHVIWKETIESQTFSHRPFLHNTKYLGSNLIPVAATGNIFGGPILIEAIIDCVLGKSLVPSMFIHPSANPRNGSTIQMASWVSSFPSRESCAHFQQSGKCHNLTNITLHVSFKFGGNRDK